MAHMSDEDESLPMTLQFLLKHPDHQHPASDA